MPIKISNDLPARGVLEDENIFFMDELRASTQNIRPLELLILNIMPTKIATETQLLRMLSNSPLQMTVDWIHMESHESKNTSAKHLESFYQTFQDIKEKRYDGFIVTGAPVEKLDFKEVDYYDELVEILEWSKKHVFSSFYICWGAQMALNYHYGIEKELLEEKLTGIYLHHTNPHKMTRKIIRGFDYQFYAPHSRHTCMNEEMLKQTNELEILASSKETGPYLIAAKDGSKFFVTGHPEYDNDTLDNEYQRDLKLSSEATMPKNYYLNDDSSQEILVRWKSHAYLLFANWLNYYVYQDTPFNLEDLENIK